MSSWRTHTLQSVVARQRLWHSARSATLEKWSISSSSWQPMSAKPKSMQKQSESKGFWGPSIAIWQSGTSAQDVAETLHSCRRKQLVRPVVLNFWNMKWLQSGSWTQRFWHVLWCSMIFYDVLWCYMMFYDDLWYSMRFYDVLVDFKMFYVLRAFLVFSCQSVPKEFLRSSLKRMRQQRIRFAEDIFYQQIVLV